MSSSSDSSSSSSGSEEGEFVQFSRIVLYDAELESLATPDEAAEHEARMTEAAIIERLYLRGTIFKLALL